MPDLPGYVGVDVAAEAIALARARHPDRTYIVGNVATMRLPRCDLVICRDAIQHLSLRDGQRVLRALLRTTPEWLLASTYIESSNDDVPTGHFYSPDLTRPPFDLGQPERLIFDGYGYHDPEAVRDDRKYLGLWRLG